MIIRNFAFLLMALAMACPAWAAVVTENQARQVAVGFFSSRHMSVGNSNMRLVHRAPSFNGSATVPYYVFNAGGNDDGFVIIAGDDRSPQVLGYSDRGSFDISDVPQAMQELLDSYAAQMSALDNGGKVAVHIGATGKIAPLLHSQWSQGLPYRSMLPVLSDGNYPPVGCVATALAQVMYYWRWPQRTQMAIPAYTTETSHINVPALPIVEFNWNAMQDTYLTDDNNSVAAQAVAQLSLYCAQSVRMDFKKNASSASTSDVPMAAYMYFNYSPTTKYVQRRYYPTTEWEEMVLKELAAKRPVIYRGRCTDGGHAFVCDGYDGNGMFHINWGWNGNSNGYFLLNVLNPDLQGTGDSDDSGYVNGQGMVIGLEPGNTGNPKLDVVDRHIEVQSYTPTRSGINENFTVTQVTHFLNLMDSPIDFDYGWALYKDNEIVKMLETGSRIGLNSNYYCYPTHTLSFGSGISKGTYRIAPLYSEPGSGDWRPCTGASVNYLEVTIEDNNCRIIVYGDAAEPYYKVNNVNANGTMHVGRPIEIALDVTNQGNTRGDVIYMFADNDNTKVIAMGYADIEKNASGIVSMRYVPEKVGFVNLKFATDDECKNVIATHPMMISAMPFADLTGSAQPLNVTDVVHSTMTSDKFGLTLTVTNHGTSAYDEDITVVLYKHIYGSTGTTVQAINQRVSLRQRQSTTLTFNFDNVMNGWQYFANAYYYSNGERVRLASVGMHTIVFPSASIRGDVNGDGEVSIADVNEVIYFIVGGTHNLKGDVNGDGEVSIADVNTVISIILGH